MTRSMAPTSFPPMNTTGTAGPPHHRREGGRGRAPFPRPRGSSSSSTTDGLTPMPQKSRFTAWHMQQVLTLKITTALSAASRSTRSSASIVVVCPIPPRTPRLRCRRRLVAHPEHTRSLRKLKMRGAQRIDVVVEFGKRSRVFIGGRGCQVQNGTYASIFMQEKSTPDFINHNILS
ncbi:hypothetical protein MUK42_01891 [Musa troglodytarum]|uniref:Uncharacterized protein n=1 Tax=Musa troglodytarum TaxID=320322 RepID=A0A9E7FF02_9LILI|nr:hypothetical protein MUK42_01891 [Musa troglodytarum]